MKHLERFVVIVGLALLVGTLALSTGRDIAVVVRPHVPTTLGPQGSNALQNQIHQDPPSGAHWLVKPTTPLCPAVQGATPPWSWAKTTPQRTATRGATPPWSWAKTASSRPRGARLAHRQLCRMVSSTPPPWSWARAPTRQPTARSARDGR